MQNFDRNKLTFLPVQAQLREVEISEEAVREAINFAIANANKRNQKQEVAEVDPVGPNQKPRMLQLSAWICHAGSPNLNGQAFLQEDLAVVVKNGLFQPPFFGMIDYNHDFNSYGAWYSAKFAFDPQAQQWGIIAEGAIFAWRYTDLADKMLAMQQRQGHIDVSMACMPGSYEEAKTPQGATYMILRDPVFFTTSVLDVEPADPAARAVGSEDPAQSSDDRTAELLRASIEATNTEEAMDVTTENETEQTQVAQTEVTTETASEETAATETVVTADSSSETDTETETEEEHHETTVLVHVEVTTTSDENETDSETDSETETTTAAAEVVAEVVTEQPDVQAQLAAALIEIERLNTANQTAQVALTAARGEIEGMTSELTTLRAEKAKRDQDERELALAKIRETRMQEIPAHIAAALDNDEGMDLIAKWMEQSDEMWTATKKIFALTPLARPSLADRSEKEGLLVVTTDPNEGGFAITRWRKRR